MDDSRKALLITGGVLILVAVLIFGVIFYVVNFFKNRSLPTSTTPTQTTSSPMPSVSNLPFSSPSPAQSQTNSSGDKIYSGANFSLNYPKSWGLLTCSNSNNFELDPNKADNMKVGCDRALKPITILVVNNLSCEGMEKNIGGKKVIRSYSSDKGGAEADYRWCVINANGLDLDITHRVSQGGGRATSKQDFSMQVEQMITTIKF